MDIGLATFLASAAGGWVIDSQRRQENFSRTCWTTYQRAGTRSSVSVTSSPSFLNSPPQHGQADGEGSTTRTRGK